MSLYLPQSWRLSREGISKLKAIIPQNDEALATFVVHPAFRIALGASMEQKSQINLLKAT
jgi:hypothetical protein